MRLAASVIASLVALTTAQSPDLGLSFPEQFSGQLADWEIGGRATYGQNKLTLTPIDVGNQHGSLWSKGRVNHNEWTFEASLSVGGPVTAGGGLALWYTADRNHVGPIHGSKDQWDGLAIMLDSTDNGEGTLRGHLNDGTIKYQGVGKMSEKAFSLCKISYRNTGSQFNIRVGYGQGSLIVDVNGQKCFETDKITLPAGQFVGVTAASTDNPDAVTVHKFKTYPAILQDMLRHKPNYQPPAQKQPQQAPKQEQKVEQLQPRDDKQYQEVMNTINQHKTKLDSVDRLATSLDNLQKKLESIEQRLGQLDSKVNDYASKHGNLKNEHQRSINQEVDKLKQQLDAQISRTVNDHAKTVFGSIPDTVNDALRSGGPPLWMLIVIVIVVQGVLFVGYSVWKTRRSYHAKIL